jgi:hypothetical protein
MDRLLQRPLLHKGNKHIDGRGIITFNNDFDCTRVKRMYTIENNSIDFKRGWQGHKIEQRWFSVIKGSFVIEIKPIIAFEQPTIDHPVDVFTLQENTLDYLQVPAGYVTCIQALETHSKLLLLSDYALGEVDDEWRFEI